MNSHLGTSARVACANFPTRNSRARTVISISLLLGAFIFTALVETGLKKLNPIVSSAPSPRGHYLRTHAVAQTSRGSRANLLGGPVPLLKSRDASSGDKIRESYGKLPLSFEANEGQVNPQVKFISRGSGYTLFLTRDEAVLALRQSESKSQKRARNVEARNWKAGAESLTAAVLRMRLVGVNPAAQVAGADEMPGKTNYFTGTDPKKWRTGILNYGKVRYAGVYPGIDLVYYGNQGQLEYDFVVAPGANPDLIKLDVGAGLAPPRRARHGARAPQAALRLDAGGNLIASIDGGEVRFHKPVVYQSLSTRAAAFHSPKKKPIDAAYVITGANQASFKIAQYDHTKPLIIDPTLAYSTYLGSTSDDEATSIAVDKSGDAYVVGLTSSTGFPTTPGVLQPASAGGYDVFVTKLSANGSALVYSTFLGGSGSDYGEGIALDASGDAYVTGQTDSTNFPTTPGAFQTGCGGGSNGCALGDGFVAELNPSGSALIYSTYLGGSKYDEGNSVVLDASGDAYVVGSTTSTNFPVTGGALQTTYGGGTEDTFVAELNPTGSALVYSTYLGGSNQDIGYGITLDSSDDAYVVGYTKSLNFPTAPGAFQTTLNAAEAGFVTKLNPTGSALIYSTYLGGSGAPGNPCAACATSVALDSAGDAYVSGLTWEPDFPTTPGAFQTTFAGGFHDAFVTELNTTGSGLVYSTYIGGKSDDGAVSVALDNVGNLYVRGNTFSKNFPTTPGAFQPKLGGLSDAFFLELNPAGSALLYSTYLGGSGSEFGMATSSLALVTGHANPNVFLTGFTNSTNFPVSQHAFQANFAGVYDAFVTKFTLGAGASAPAPGR